MFILNIAVFNSSVVAKIRAVKEVEGKKELFLPRRRSAVH